MNASGPPRESADKEAAAPARAVLAEVGRMLWPVPGDRHGPLTPMLVTLTVVTGIVDATSYLRLGHVFVANMTGNVVFLGFALAGASGLSAGASLLALAAFLLGALAGGWLGARHGEHRGHLLRAANLAQAALLAIALTTALLSPAAPDRGVRDALIVTLALALGIQNAAAQRLAVPDLTTTVLTRTLTGLASETGLVGGAGSKAGRRAVAIVAMLVGALIGALLVLNVSIASAIAVALGLVLAVGTAVQLASRTDAPWTHP
jgi:uncharacterized membrane protein YoaK (UPF0700 family)